ncbi:MAG: N-6 DNA methylase [Methylococcales bacterium]
MPLFNKKIIQQNLTIQDIPTTHLSILQNWQTRIANRDLETQSEVALQGVFMQSIMVDVLGYQQYGEQTYSIAKEYPIARGAVDVALGQFTADKHDDQLHAVLELKGAKTKNLDAIMSGRFKTPVQQAWDYARDAKGCQWILVSNYVELRLYAIAETSLIYEQFELAKLTDPEEYTRFILCLHADNLLTGNTKELLEQSHQATKDITARFYADYKAVRETLITRLIEDNSEIKPLELIAPAQKLLDRILFVAFSEDRGLIPHHSIEQAYKHVDIYNPKPVYHNFKGLFNAINKGSILLKVPAYNGGLFAPDKLFDKLNVADELCTGFLELAKYDFNSEISVTVLGHIFEQSIADLEDITAQIQSGNSLQKTVKTTSVTGKRKQHGVVYTPDHITAFIVEHTLGEHLQQRFEVCLNNFGTVDDEGKINWHDAKRTSKKLKKKLTDTDIELQFWDAWQTELETIKIVDPACGSGAFLVAAFDVLYAEYRRINDKIAEITGQRPARDLNKEILNRNLSGVDVNPESIEITKLSLWLKTAERGKKLATIDQHLQVGNSLGFTAPVSEGGFCWQNQFAKIMQSGGFDVVLGNPPYVRQELLGDVKPYLQKNYKDVYHGVADLYAYFFELGLKLLKPNGMLGFISSATFFKTSSGEPLRHYLQTHATLKKVVDFGDLQVFESVTTYPAILIFQNAKPKDDSEIQTLVLKNNLPKKLSETFAAQHGVMAHAQLRADSWQLEDARLSQLRDKLTRGYPTLKAVYGSPLYGIKTGLNEAFVIDRATKDKLIQQDPNSAELLKPFLEGKDLKKWHSAARDLWLIFIPWHFPLHKDLSIKGASEKAEQEFEKQYPAIYQHLTQFKSQLSARNKAETGIHYEWYALQRYAASYYEEFEKPKIIYNRFMAESNFWLDNKNYYFNNALNLIPKTTYYELGILLSPVHWFLLTANASTMSGGFYQIHGHVLEKLPIPPATPEQKTHIGTLAEQCQILAEQRYTLETNIRRRFPDLGVVKLTQKLERWWLLDFKAVQDELKKSYKIDIPLKERGAWQAFLEEAKTEREQLAAQITLLEKELNTAVYALFDLTDEEISLIESA